MCRSNRRLTNFNGYPCNSWYLDTTKQETKMNTVKTPFLILLLLASISCQPKNKSNKEEVAQKESSEPQLEAKLTAEQLQDYETAYFASGCFWCVEAIFESVKGVKEVYSGYAGGTEKNPTYEEVSYGRTTHAEAVKIFYDPKVISFTQLVQVFFGSHDLLILSTWLKNTIRTMKKEIPTIVMSEMFRFRD